MTDKRYKHGWAPYRAERPEFRVWCSMLQRAWTGTSKRGAKFYKERGILVCERWLEFANFIADKGPRPSPAHTLEREDNEKGYEPGNCKWATRKEQARNRRSSRYLTARGETKLLCEWAEALGVHPATILGRLARGWSVEEAVLTPVSPRGRKAGTPRHLCYGRAAPDIIFGRPILFSGGVSGAQ